MAHFVQIIPHERKELSYFDRSGICQNDHNKIMIYLWLIGCFLVRFSTEPNYNSIICLVTCRVTPITDVMQSSLDL